MLKRKSGFSVFFRALALPLAVIAALLVFFTALQNLEAGRGGEGRDTLEASIRRATTACYASEGVYPPNLEYLEQHYGLQIDKNEYDVFYESFAENLMPGITVLERSK